AVERLAGSARVAPDDFHRTGIELDDACPTLRPTVVAEIVEEQDVAAGQKVRIVLADPWTRRRPDDLPAGRIENGNGARAEFAERQEELPLFPEWEIGSRFRVDIGNRVRMERILEREAGDHVAELEISRFHDRLDQMDFVELLPVRRKDDEVIVQARRLQMVVPAHFFARELLRQHVYFAVRTDIELVMGTAGIGPDDI